MSVSSYSQQNNWPYGAVAQLVNGKTTAISNSYVGTLTAGYYAFSGVSLNDKASALVLSSASTNTTIRIKSKETEYFELTSSASDIVFESEGALPTAETNVIGRGTGSLFTVAYGNNKYVIATSAANTTAYVSDGINGAWNPVDMGISTATQGTSGFGNGKFVIAGSATTGGFTSSTDGTTWSTSYFGRGFTWNSVRYLNNLWVAIGNRSALATSTDAVSWNWISGQMPTTGTVWSITTGPSFALAATQSGYINISTTGVGWDFAFLSSGSAALRSIVYANSLFVTAGASGYLATSTDGRNWTSRTSGFGSTQINEINYGASTWVAVGAAGQLRTSTDATTWTTRTSGFGSTQINSVAYGNSVWVAAGDAGQMRTSTDAITWGTVTSGFGTTVINKVKYLNGLWLAAGAAGQLRTSTDAVTWTTRTSGFGTSIIYDMTYFNSQYIAVGVGSTIRYSTDAVTWSNATWDTQPSTVLYSIGEKNGRLFVSGASGYIYSSTDGIAWSQFYNGYSGAASITGNGVAYASGIYTVATSSSAVGVTSTDGITWTRNTSTQQLTDVVAGSTGFIGVTSGVFYSSTNGIAYTLLVDTSVTSLNRLLYSDNQYLAYSNNSGTGLLYTSTDATTWNQRTYVSTTASIYELIRGGGTQYVAVDGTASNVAWSTSTSATTWRRAGIGESSASAAAQNSNYIVAAGGDNILYAPTTTPTVWTQVVNTDATSVYAAAAAPTTYALATDSALLFSTNASTWQVQIANATADIVYDSFSNVYLAASGLTAEELHWGTASNGSFTTVTLAGFDLNPMLKKIAAYNGWYLVGAANGQVAIGRNYKNNADFIYQTLDSGSPIVGVAIGDEFAVALAESGNIFYCKLSEISDQAFLSISTLTTSAYYVTQNWQLAYTPVISGTYVPVGVAYNNGTFVALMSTTGVLWSSTDGANWSNLSIGQATNMGSYTGIAPYGTGQFYLNTFGTVSQTTGGSLPSAFSLYQVSLPNL